MICLDQPSYDTLKHEIGSPFHQKNIVMILLTNFA